MPKFTKYVLPTVASMGVRALVTRLAVVAAVAGGTVFATQSSTSPTFGIDFGWGGPSVSAMHSAGVKFADSYLSYDHSKNWQVTQIRAYHQAGIATTFTWETTATRALAGCAAGASDAREAERQIRADGAPANTPFQMAIDFDATGPDVAPYFRCASQAEPGLVNGYGGAGPISYLCAHNLVGHVNFVTYAWLYRTHGQWPSASCAPLQQYSNGHLVGGRDVDFDRALLPYYGQWGGPVVTPPKPRLICFGPTAKLQNATCKKVRPLVSQWSHDRVTQLRDRAWDHGILKGYHCRKPYRRGICIRAGRLDRRIARELHWDNVHIAAALHQYS